MTKLFAAAVSALSIVAGASAAAAADAGKPVPALLEELSRYQQDEATVARNLDTFDTLDFDVYTHQKWDRLGESHARDILVHYPDGTTTKGLHDHIEALKPMFVFAPDTRIEQHPVKFGKGEWTGVIGLLEGTFTKPMPIGGGKTIPPTGKPFKLSMATIGHWTGDGVMDEEYLFWDNQDFMKQIGLGQ
ncbi:ester cyclase [Pleomorphomonas carboxyditropha]|uniref:Polyketide cyclase n=1 Tax=Pleomorphomonas carboxyditropha TaxID=2023338 RepID=A0A2G9WRT8_9HYPH|nr:ester cyclase [Pleomorphomonas carboxyditropha]PIO97393.1 polyketide cyclase [Pleomorphomonas carboxyditropha]